MLLTDLGSICGTYIRVKQDSPLALQPGQSFLVGNDFIIDIDNVFSYESTPFDISPEMNTTMQNAPQIHITISKIPTDNLDITVTSLRYSFLSEDKYKLVTIGRSTV